MYFRCIKDNLDYCIDHIDTEVVYIYTHIFKIIKSYFDIPIMRIILVVVPHILTRTFSQDS